MGGSSVFSLTPSSVADLFLNGKRGRVMAIIAIGYDLGPSVSPTDGSYINAAWGWQWVFCISRGLGLVVMVLNLAALSELYEPVLLCRRAAGIWKQERLHGEEVRSRFEFDVPTARWEMLARAMLRPLRVLVCSKTLFLTSSLTAIGYGCMYTLYKENWFRISRYCGRGVHRYDSWCEDQ